MAVFNFTSYYYENICPEEIPHKNKAYIEMCLPELRLSLERIIKTALVRQHQSGISEEIHKLRIIRAFTCSTDIVSSSDSLRKRNTRSLLAVIFVPFYSYSIATQ